MSCAGQKACSVPIATALRSPSRGRDDTPPERQRYLCKSCHRRFDDLTDTVFAGHHQPLRIWILCLYFMGLNLSNRQIAQELDLHKDDVHHMTTQLRQGIVSKAPSPTLSGEVECDEVYIVAGHKGHREAVAKKGVWADDDVSKVPEDVVPSTVRNRRSSG